MAIPRLAIAAVAASMAVAPAAAQSVSVDDVASPRGETTRVLLEKPDAAWVTLVLFAGGKGGMEMSKSGDIGNLKGNFLIRSRRHFHALGAATAIVDAPSDRSNLSDFRDTEGHAADVGAVIRRLKATLKLPVWVVGTSNGTTSAANAGLRLAGDARPDGVVLTSSRVETSRGGVSLLAMDLDKVTGPVLIAHHRGDSCAVTLPDGVPRIVDALANAKPVKVLWYEGGEGVRGDPCQAYHYHGFRGLESQVVADIVAWIKNPAP